MRWTKVQVTTCQEFSRVQSQSETGTSRRAYRRSRPGHSEQRCWVLSKVPRVTGVRKPVCDLAVSAATTVVWLNLRGSAGGPWRAQGRVSHLVWFTFENGSSGPATLIAGTYWAVSRVRPSRAALQVVAKPLSSSQA